MIRLIVAVFALIWCGSSAALASNPVSLDQLTERVGTLEASVKDFGVPIPPLPIKEPDGRIQVAQSAAGLAVRVDRLEQQMRQYTGQMEELNFRIRQLQEQLKRFQEDSEFRFQDLEKGKKRSSRLPSATKPVASQQFEQLGSPPQNLGSLSQDQMSIGSNISGGTQPGAGPIDLSSMLGGGPGASGGLNGGNIAAAGALTGDPATDYDSAYKLVLQGNYSGSEQMFRDFVNAYPNDRLAPNAHYWIGESLFQQGDYRGAIEIFLDAYSQFPNAQNAPDMLLKTGMSLRQINERDAACATFEELLQKFPNASSGVRQKVRSEIKNAGC